MERIYIFRSHKIFRNFFFNKPPTYADVCVLIVAGDQLQKIKPIFTRFFKLVIIITMRLSLVQRSVLVDKL